MFKEISIFNPCAPRKTFVAKLWVVRGQKEDTEEEKIGGTSVLNNRTYIQNKSISTAGRSAHPKTVRFDCWEEVSLLPK